MVVGEFTASNIAMEEDAKEVAKKSVVDMVKLSADIETQRVIAKQVRDSGTYAIIIHRMQAYIPSSPCVCTS